MGSGEIQSNLEIAGSPRNSFRASLKCKSLGGRALIGLGVHRITEFSQTPNANDLSGSQTASDKIRSQRKQPRPPAKIKVCVSGKGCGVA